MKRAPKTPRPPMIKASTSKIPRSTLPKNRKMRKRESAHEKMQNRCDTSPHSNFPFDPIKWQIVREQRMFFMIKFRLPLGTFTLCVLRSSSYFHHSFPRLFLISDSISLSILPLYCHFSSTSRLMPNEEILDHMVILEASSSSSPVR